MSQNGWLKQEIYFSPFWKLSPRSRHWKIWCLVRALFLVCRWPSVFFLYAHMARSEIISLMFLLLRVLNPLTKATPSWPNYFPKGPLPNAIILGIRVLTLEVQRDTNISSITQMIEISTLSSQIAVSKYQFQLNGSRTLWRNAWFRVWDRNVQDEPRISCGNRCPGSFQWRLGFYLKDSGAIVIVQRWNQSHYIIFRAK